MRSRRHKGTQIKWNKYSHGHRLTTRKKTMEKKNDMLNLPNTNPQKTKHETH